MKKSLTAIIIIYCMLFAGIPTFASDTADSGIKIRVYDYYNDKILTPDVPPQIIDGRTMVPVRIVSEALGAEVSWDGETKTVIASKGVTVVRIPINSMTARSYGEDIPLDVPAQIIDGRTLVPLRFISEAFGATVDWDSETRTVSITGRIKPGYKSHLVHRGYDLVGAFTLPDYWVEEKDESGDIRMYINKSEDPDRPGMMMVNALESAFTPDELVSRPEIMLELQVEALKLSMPNATIHSAKFIEHNKDMAMYEYRLTNRVDNVEVNVICHYIIKGDTLYITQVLGSDNLSQYVPAYKEMLKSIIPNMGGS